MAAGERGFSSKGTVATKREFPLIPAGDYQLKLLGEHASIKIADKVGAFPYVNARFEVLDSAKEEGAKNPLLFHMFFTSLRPMKDGNLQPNNADQIVGYAHGLGEEFETEAIVQQKDDNGKLCDAISAKAIEKWLKEHDGAVVNAKVTVQRATAKDLAAGYSDKNKIAYFIEAEGGVAGPDDGDEAGDEEVETGPDAEETDSEPDEELSEAGLEEDEEVEEEPAPPPKKAAVKVAPKVAPKKVVQGPAKKSATRR